MLLRAVCPEWEWFLGLAFAVGSILIRQLSIQCQQAKSLCSGARKFMILWVEKICCVVFFYGILIIISDVLCDVISSFLHSMYKIEYVEIKFLSHNLSNYMAQCYFKILIKLRMAEFDSINTMTQAFFTTRCIENIPGKLEYISH